jgi:hypothetical protein
MSVQQRAEVDVSISVLMWWAVTDVHAILATFWNQTIIIANVMWHSLFLCLLFCLISVFFR